MNKTAVSGPHQTRNEKEEAEDNYSSLLKKSGNEIFVSKVKKHVKSSVSPVKNKKSLINVNVKSEMKQSSLYGNFGLKFNLP